MRYAPPFIGRLTYFRLRSTFTLDKKQPKRNIHDSEDDDEPDEKPRQPISPPSSPRRKVGEGSSRVKSGGNNTADPLAEFYDQARARHAEAVRSTNAIYIFL